MSMSMAPNCHWLPQEQGRPMGLSSVGQLVQYWEVICAHMPFNQNGMEGISTSKIS